MQMGDTPRINDSLLWQRDYNRQLQGVKGALHSLRLQTAERQVKHKGTKALKQMEHVFDMVEIAFQALNTPEEQETSVELYPAPAYRSKKTLDQALGLEK